MSLAQLDYKGSEVAALEALGRAECIDRWTKQFGQEPPKYISVQFMRQALAYEAQKKVYGGHSAAVRKVLKGALKHDRTPGGMAAAATVPPATALRSGTHLVREWNGRSYQVEVLETGFRMDGKQYRSLSAIARKITGAHWSGPRFFGLG